MSELISRRLRSMLMDYLSANSVLREIDSEFEAEGIPYAEPQKEVSGARRSLIQGYYEQLDFANPADARRFLNVLAVFIGKIKRTIRDPRPWGNDVSRDAQRVLEELERFSIIPAHIRMKRSSSHIHRA